MKTPARNGCECICHTQGGVHAAPCCPPDPIESRPPLSAADFERMMKAKHQSRPCEHDSCKENAIHLNYDGLWVCDEHIVEVL